MLLHNEQHSGGANAGEGEGSRLRATTSMGKPQARVVAAAESDGGPELLERAVGGMGMGKKAGPGGVGEGGGGGGSGGRGSGGGGSSKPRLPYKRPGASPATAAAATAASAARSTAPEVTHTKILAAAALLTGGAIAAAAAAAPSAARHRSDGSPDDDGSTPFIVHGGGTAWWILLAEAYDTSTFYSDLKKRGLKMRFQRRLSSAGSMWLTLDGGALTRELIAQCPSLGDKYR